MRFAAFIMLGALATCPAVAGPQPTATEIFHLRTECMKLGKELLEENEVKEASNYVSSKYDEKTNRCYAMITQWYIKENSKSVMLFDAQGGGLIALWYKCFESNTNKGEFGTIKGEQVSQSAAYVYIQNTMKDDMGEEN